jgi:serine/threonine protein kinase
MLTIGTRLGPYQILAPLGQGGMGEVYRAKDLRLDRQVAVKVVSEELAQDPDRLARFEREAKAVAALAHPNILVLYDVGREQGVPFAVTELLEGVTLRGRLADAAVPWRDALEIGATVAEGLAAAHAKGIIHRDIKPENLFLTTEGRVKILDFGLARLDSPPPGDLETGPYMPGQTDPGTVMGTLGYMSPEQLRGLPVDGRSDLFSLGCVLFELVAAKRPFQGMTAAETAAAILHDAPPRLASLGVNAPPEVEDVIRQCLAKEPGQRVSSARDLAFALRALLSGSGHSAAGRHPRGRDGDRRGNRRDSAPAPEQCAEMPTRPATHRQRGGLSVLPEGSLPLEQAYCRRTQEEHQVV